MKSKNTLLLIDVLGAAALLTMVSLTVWFSFLKPDTASSRMRSMSIELTQLEADLRGIRTAFDNLTGEHRLLMQRAEASGKLPERSSIDHDLHEITGLAKDSNLRLEQVQPVATVIYPNVREKLYRLISDGTFADHLRFLRAFEQCSFWADVTYFKLEQVNADPKQADPARKCELALSFYSSVQ